MGISSELRFLIVASGSLGYFHKGGFEYDAFLPYPQRIKRDFSAKQRKIEELSSIERIETKGKSLRTILMIMSIGGSPEPLKKSIDEHKPERIIFLASHDFIASAVDDAGSIRRMPGMRSKCGSVERISFIPLLSMVAAWMVSREVIWGYCFSNSKARSVS
jgi:hypothetical protein